MVLVRRQNTNSKWRRWLYTVITFTNDMDLPKYTEFIMQVCLWRFSSTQHQTLWKFDINLVAILCPSLCPQELSRMLQSLLLLRRLCVLSTFFCKFRVLIASGRSHAVQHEAKMTSSCGRARMCVIPNIIAEYEIRPWSRFWAADWGIWGHTNWVDKSQIAFYDAKLPRAPDQKWDWKLHF